VKNTTGMLCALTGFNIFFLVLLPLIPAMLAQVGFFNPGLPPELLASIFTFIQQRCRRSYLPC
jgi:hypothetical protein